MLTVRFKNTTKKPEKKELVIDLEAEVASEVTEVTEDQLVKKVPETPTIDPPESMKKANTDPEVEVVSEVIDLPESTKRVLIDPEVEVATEVIEKVATEKVATEVEVATEVIEKLSKVATEVEEATEEIEKVAKVATEVEAATEEIEKPAKVDLEETTEVVIEKVVTEVTSEVVKIDQEEPEVASEEMIDNESEFFYNSLLYLFNLFIIFIKVH